MSFRLAWGRFDMAQTNFLTFEYKLLELQRGFTGSALAISGTSFSFGRLFLFHRKLARTEHAKPDRETAT